ncbi:MAG: alanine--tRNA ligase [Candidatus Gracilibacteria bacterium]
MNSQEIRRAYIEFFLSKDHKQITTSSVVPENDPTVLFTTAGMQQFVPYLMGKEHPLGGKLCSVQKCVRTNDIDDVGDPRHLTFFEMLGNWSLGTYFKKESIAMSYEFLTQHLHIAPEKLFVTVFEGQDAVPLDEESIQYWIDNGIPRERIFPLAAGDNWWPTYGAKGPCGPDTEIYYDTGRPKCENGDNCKPGCDCDKYLEIWNNVFMQFYCDGEGNFTKLAKQNVDTGMGLERITMVLNGHSTVFETDLFRPIIETIEKMSGMKYAPFSKKEEELTDEERAVTKSIRIVADHIRAASVMIGDGVAPSNEGRGYVLRRLIRRAIYNMKSLLPEGTKVELTSLVDIVDGILGEHYTELRSRKTIIKNTIELETEKFLETIEKGQKMLTELIQNAVRNESRVIPGAEAFKLYDTFGFPVSLTLEIAKKEDVEVDMDEYTFSMESQKERSREGAKGMFTRGREAVQTELTDLPKTEFLGYGEDSKRMSLEGAKVLKVIPLENEEMAIITDKSVFYAEGGGQVGDTGVITPDAMQANDVLVVTDTQKYDGVWVHFCNESTVRIKEGESISMYINEERRRRIMAHHTGAHLFHLALHEVLGDGADQAGSYVDAARMRFDFNYPKALTEQQLNSIEFRVNELINAWLPVKKEELSMNEAKERGAIGLFTEKYGETVRVITIGESVSTELCGGTHVSNTSEIGIAKIIKESSVASGIRRVEMICGRSVYDYLIMEGNYVKGIMNELKVGKIEEVVERLKTQKQVIKDFEVLTAELKMKAAAGSIQEFAKEVIDKNGLKFIEKNMGDATMDEIKNIASLLRKDKIADAGVLTNTNGQFIVFSDAAEMTARMIFEEIRAANPSVKGGGNDGMVQGSGM